MTLNFRLIFLFCAGFASSGSAIASMAPVTHRLPDEVRSLGMRASTPEDLTLSEADCVPFNLEDRGTLAGVPDLRQFFSNCYAAGAAGEVSAWLVSKKSAAETGAISKSSDANRSVEEIRASVRLAVSPQHLGVSYALHRKGLPFFKDWTAPDESGRSPRDRFIHLVVSPKTDEQRRELHQIAMDRMYYFEAGGGSSIEAIRNLVDHPVCPVQMIEGRLKTESETHAFFRGIRLAYNQFLADPERIQDVMTALTGVYDRAGIPADARLTQDEVQEALARKGMLGATDPLRWLNEVLYGLCKNSQSHPPISLSQQFKVQGKPAAQMPSSIAVDAEDPLFSRTFIEKYFFASSAHSDPHQVQPLGISYAGHAIWEGPGRLSWKYDTDLKRYTNDGKEGGHYSLIVGRRWNSKAGRCEFRIKNSFLTSKYSPGYSQAIDSKTNYWIEDHLLFRSINQFRYLVDRFGNP